MRELFNGLSCPVEFDVPMASYTWYGLGGPAAVMAHPASVQQLSALAAYCHENAMPVYVLGSGANLLVEDDGIPGIVVQLDDPCFQDLNIAGTTVATGAGYDLMKLVLETSKAGLAGLECLAGIPATVGGAVRMNAGGAFGDIGQSVSRIQVMDNTGHVYYRDSEDLVFGYRKTNIAARFILSVEFELTREDPDSLVRRVKELFLYKKNSQPMAAHSPGCTFKNPIDDAARVGPRTAGQLIDDAGLKGHRIGRVQVSQQHANFVIAEPGASAAEVVAVLEHIESTVFARYGVRLEREIVQWP